jgi:hypothetical protein
LCRHDLDLIFGAMGTWDDFEAEQAAIEARRERYPAARDALLGELQHAWPPHPIEPPQEGWVEPGSAPVFREGIRGKTWLEIAPELVQREYAMMSILPPAGLAECLPAWLASAAKSDEGNVASWLVEILQPPRSHTLQAMLSSAQRMAVRHTLEALALRWAGKPSEQRVNELVETWGA